MSSYDIFESPELFNLDEIAPQIIEKQKKESYKKDKEEAQQKINNVSRFIESNPTSDVRYIQQKFNLDWSLIKEYDNGIAKIGFYTDETLRFLCFEIHDDVNSWFR